MPENNGVMGEENEKKKKDKENKEYFGGVSRQII